MEGALELELSSSKFRLITKSFLGAILPIFLLSFTIAFFFNHLGNVPLRTALINAIPLSIISSAIAIPSIRESTTANKEYITYESSFSDIIGVIFFNFIVTHPVINLSAFGHFSVQVVIIGIISFIATIGLSLLLSRIEHHIKFIPIILLVIIIYAIAELWHLPALIFIMLFGLFLGNLRLLRKIKKIERLHHLRIDELCLEVKRFRELTYEATFLVKALFFLLFGFLIETSELLNLDTLLWSIGICTLILVIRFVQLKLSKLPLFPLLFIAPRGLITILLFLSIPLMQKTSFVNRSLITQVIVITIFSMMFGFMFSEKKEFPAETKDDSTDKAIQSDISISSSHSQLSDKEIR